MKALVSCRHSLLPLAALRVSKTTYKLRRVVVEVVVAVVVVVVAVVAVVAVAVVVAVVRSYTLE